MHQKSLFGDQKSKKKFWGGGTPSSHTSLLGASTRPPHKPSHSPPQLAVSRIDTAPLPAAGACKRNRCISFECNQLVSKYK